MSFVSNVNRKNLYSQLSNKLFTLLVTKGNIFITFIFENKIMKCSDLLRKLIQAGIKVDRQGKGSHIILLRKDGDKFTFPDHGSDKMGRAKITSMLN